MGVPKRKVSKSRRDKRRTHDRLVIPARSICPQCQEVTLPHHVCPACGFYKGKEVLKLSEV